MLCDFLKLHVCLFHESTISAIYNEPNCKERFSFSITVTIKAIYARQLNLREECRSIAKFACVVSLILRLILDMILSIYYYSIQSEYRCLTIIPPKAKVWIIYYRAGEYSPAARNLTRFIRKNKVIHHT